MERLSMDPNNTWLTADTHFGNGNIIRYCKHPFASVAEHDGAIMGALARLTEKDVPIHLATSASTTVATSAAASSGSQGFPAGK